MGQYVMGIDNGSQSTKVTIFDFKGNEIAYGSKNLKPLSTPEPGVVLHPDDDLWESVKGGIENCLENFDGNPKDIVGIGLCTIRCCRALLKEDGTLAYPVLSWMDARMSDVYKHENDDVKYVTSTSGYLCCRLTGVKRDTASNLECGWPLNWETLDWYEDDDIIKEHGLTRDMLFELVKPGELFGYIKEDIAEEFGLSKDVPVIATANDKAVEVLGAGIKDKKQIMISLGTFISSMIYREKYFDDAKTFFPTLASIPHNYVYESIGIRRGMWTVSWFKNLLGDELTLNAEKLNISEEEYLNILGKEAPAGSDGLITLLDWLASPATPYRKGVMIGFDQRHTIAHMYRSILEGIAYNLKNNIDEMLEEIDEEIGEITIIGGGSKSDLVMQIFADMFNMPTVRNESNSAACLGAAICVCKYLGVYSNFEEAIKNMVRAKEIFYPNSNLYTFYGTINNKVIKNARKFTDEILKESFEIFS